MRASGSLPRSDYVWIGVLYSLAWGALLLNSEFVYWDDWGLVNQSATTRDAFYVMVAAPLKGIMHNALQQIGNGVWIYRLLTYLVYLVVALSLLWLVRQLSAIPRGPGFWLVAVSATYPVNQARIALIDLPYGITLATFLVATVLSIRATRSGSIPVRITAIFLFLFSFFTKSLLVFYVVPMAVLLWVGRASWWRGLAAASVGRLAVWGIRHADYLLAPIVFFVLTNRYLVPNTLYGNYNEISAAQLPQAVIATLRSMLNLSWLPVTRIFDVALHRNIFSVVAVVAVAGLVGILLYRCHRRGRPVTGKLSGIGIGAALLFLAIFPYQMVNKIPAHLDWLSRHQLLIPFGAAVLVTAILRLVCKPRDANIGAGLVVIASIITVNVDLLWYYTDGVKQQGVISALRQQPEVRAARNRIVAFEDNATELNAMDRFYRYYEYNGFMKVAFDDSSRFGDRNVTVGDWDPERLRTMSSFANYNFDGFNPVTFDTVGTVVIRPGSYWPVDLPEQLGLLITGLGDRNGLQGKIDDIVELEFNPARPADPD